MFVCMYVCICATFISLHRQKKALIVFMILNFIRPIIFVVVLTFLGGRVVDVFQCLVLLLYGEI